MLRFSSLWEVAIAKGWCTLNIVDRLEPVKVPGPDVRIYPNDTTLNILAAVISEIRRSRTAICSAASARARPRSSVASSLSNSPIWSSVKPAAWAERMKRSRWRCSAP